MTWIGDAALWFALILSGLAAGMLATRWRETQPGDSRLVDLLLLLAAGSSVVAWSADAGALLATGAPPALLTASVPNEVSAGYRLAVLWATMPGAALTLGMLLLVAAALAAPPRSSSSRRVRLAAVASVQALIALGIATWFAPATATAPATVPPFVLSAAAAAAPLLALVAVAVLGWCVAAVMSRSGREAMPRLPLLASWLAATGAVAAEQLARSQLGIGPRDAVVLGSASSGLVLWLAIGALFHRRVQGLWSAGHAPTGTTEGSRAGRWATHAGALVLALSFAAHIVASRQTLALPPGKAVEVTDAFRRSWRLTNQGVSRFDADVVDVMAIAIEAGSPGGATTLVSPELREYHRRDGKHVPAGMGVRRSVRGLVQEMRILLVSADSVDVASVRVTFLPFPILWPAGLVLLGIAVVLLASTTGSNPARPDA